MSKSVLFYVSLVEKYIKRKNKKWEKENFMKNISKGLWGIVLIAIGVVIGLNSFGVANIDIFFDGWWTLFIIGFNINCLFIIL